MEGPRVVLLVLLLLFILFSPEPQPQNRLRHFQPQAQVDELPLALNVLRNSSYGDLSASEGRWLNLTGFREDDGYQWESLPIAQAIARRRFLNATGGGGNRTGDELEDSETLYGRKLPVYQNVTSEVRGKVSRVDFELGHQESRINLTELVPGGDYVSSFFSRNVTEDHGEIVIDLKDLEYAEGNGVIPIEARIAIETDSSPSNGWQLSLSGVHFRQSGQIFLTTDSEKYDSKFALPHFVLTEGGYNAARQTVNQTMTKYVEQNEGARRLTTGSLILSAPSCEYLIWLQQHPITYHGVPTFQTTTWLEHVEHELMYPDGAPHGISPSLSFSAILFSPDCGFILESNGPLVGAKAEVYSALAKRLLVAFIIILSLEVFLLKKQMQEATTPSTKSRIAYQTFGLMALGDGHMCTALLFLTVADDSIWLLSSAALFVCVMNVLVLETKFINDIWTVQVGDPAQRERERRSNAQPAPAPVTAPVTTTNALPLPATAPRDTGASPIILPPDQDVEAAQTQDQILAAAATAPTSQAAFSAVYSQFYFFLVTLTFLSFWATSWPYAIRSAYANLLALAYLSFWTPQIYRNIIRNCRKALSWEYVAGISILRLIPIVYWYFEERNILHVNAHPSTAYVLICWVCLQVTVLVIQQFLGPRLFLKDDWCPPAYDFHPLLREDGDEEAGKMLPIGFIASASEAKDKDGKIGNRKFFDCAICMNEIDVPVMSKGDTSTTWLEQWSYMVTPCRHIFHTECLEGWMNLRLVCPVCREGLPPM